MSPASSTCVQAMASGHELSWHERTQMDCGGLMLTALQVAPGMKPQSAPVWQRFVQNPSTTINVISSAMVKHPSVWGSSQSPGPRQDE